MKSNLRIGLFGIGLDACWEQFAGLKDRPEGYLHEVHTRIERPGVKVVNPLKAPSLMKIKQLSILTAALFALPGFSLYSQTNLPSPAAKPAPQDPNTNSLEQLLEQWGKQNAPKDNLGYMVIRNGKIVAENYWGGADRSALMLAASSLPSTTRSSVKQVIPGDCKAPGWVDVSHGIGIPLGTLGAGYSVFGKFGFVKVHFDGDPTPESYHTKVPGLVDYTMEPETKSSYGFLLTCEGKTYVLQQTPAAWKPEAIPFDAVFAYAFLPKGVVTFDRKEQDLRVTVNMFSPLIAHDLATSTTPVQIYDVTVENLTLEPKQMQLKLQNALPGTVSGNQTVFTSKSGTLAFGAINGKADPYSVGVDISMAPNDKQTFRFVIGWNYPALHHGKDNTKPQVRYYTKNFPDASSVVTKGLKEADGWLARVNAWHDSYQVPAPFKRLWFNSLTSVMTSTIMGAEPSFFEVETPHRCLNTMDVNVYSGWVYLANWPEIAKLDMEQYFGTIATTGSKSGLVLHSLWKDEAHYVEEPTFLCRFYRDQLWFNDPAWTKEGFPLAVAAANRVFNETNGRYESLINSLSGGQSYDCWMMPGVSSYVNSAWIYGLYGLERVSRQLGQPALINGTPAGQLLPQALENYDKLLWNGKNQVWNCFYRTPGASQKNNPESFFTDQLFGRWLLAIDPGSDSVLPKEKVATALQSLYANNLVDDPANHFRGWVNGMLPGRQADLSSMHAYTFWFGPQINLGSLLGLAGNEKASLDVFESIESSLHNNHLAAGEWNQVVTSSLASELCKSEPGKDTPRFAPYPRYKSCWEYVIRLIGLQMDSKYLYLNPFKTFAFSYQNVHLAGCDLTVKVELGWTKARLNGREVTLPVKIDRSVPKATVEFVR